MLLFQILVIFPSTAALFMKPFLISPIGLFIVGAPFFTSFNAFTILYHVLFTMSGKLCLCRNQICANQHASKSEKGMLLDGMLG